MFLFCAISQGLARSVGVSNIPPPRAVRIYKAMERDHGVRLAFYEAECSLLHVSAPMLRGDRTLLCFCFFIEGHE